jgi:hypothetical protein
MIALKGDSCTQFCKIHKTSNAVRNTVPNHIKISSHVILRSPRCTTRNIGHNFTRYVAKSRLTAVGHNPELCVVWVQKERKKAVCIALLTMHRLFTCVAELSKTFPLNVPRRLIYFSCIIGKDKVCCDQTRPTLCHTSITAL